jgi:predicted N-acetyltransferase YhbS
MNLRIEHLHDHPEQFPTVAHWIHREFWVGREGHSPERMEARLRTAADPDRIPLSLLALVDGVPAGTVNLVENDDEERPQLTPWLAALLVVPEHREKGVGSQLVRELVKHGRRLGVPRMYLGTDIPAFYERLEARVHEQVTDAFCVMVIEVPE